MGGRGKRIGKSYEQTSLKEAVFKNEVAKICNETRRVAKENEKEIFGGSGAEIGNKGAIIKPDKKQLLKKCACCSEYTIPFGSKYVMCPECGWIDDPYQNMHPDSTQGKNAVSLNEAKFIWLKNGKQ